MTRQERDSGGAVAAHRGIAVSMRNERLVFQHLAAACFEVCYAPHSPHSMCAVSCACSSTPCLCRARSCRAPEWDRGHHRRSGNYGYRRQISQHGAGTASAANDYTARRADTGWGCTRGRSIIAPRVLAPGNPLQDGTQAHTGARLQTGTELHREAGGEVTTFPSRLCAFKQPGHCGVDRWKLQSLCASLVCCVVARAMIMPASMGNSNARKAAASACSDR